MLRNTREIHQIYCLQRMAGGYLPLNREYKPLGYCYQKFVRYEDFPNQVLPIEVTPELARRLSWNGSDELCSIYLYDHKCRPYRNGTGSDKATADYLKRLALIDRLLKKQLRGAELVPLAAA